MGSKVQTQLRKLRTQAAIQKRKAKKSDPFAFSNNPSSARHDNDFDDEEYADGFDYEEYEDE